ncbi:signal transduction histidine kinase [Flavobacterium sp. CG_23.5]|uniref:sensor histidine kinase n=1 Tax=Flavobacterium sp. CG_23.5 TaxID=2760708 RepID=UPI001AE47377|nr:HAMP domain-containing sensor histidine kinase [Flavobacterium sp. CG_23.5]MBP2284655.1 signal transduction histidine kinase [Flavobacterium sp. CG_23.5]
MAEAEKKCQEELSALKKEYEDFVYIVSHDIKTPMRAISNIAKWIEDDLGADINIDVLNNFTLLKNRVGRLENMLNALLELSRVNRTEMEFYEVNIPKIVEGCIASLDNKLNVTFHVNYNLLSENCVTLGKKLNKVIFNLLDNAVRFHDKEIKNVFVDVTEKELDYELKISDDGPGISTELKERIFSIFYTVNSKDVIDSTGAGLTISSKIIEMVGGSIRYIPAENSGSIFQINWPKKINLKN